MITIISFGLWTISFKEESMPIEGTIIQIVETNHKERWTINCKGNKIYAYVSFSEEAHVGWRVKIEGSIESIEKNRVKYGFNYQEYLHYNHIHTIVNASKVQIVEKRFHIFRIEEWVREWVSGHFENESKAFLFALILGDDSDFDDSFQQSLQKNGIVHLFAVSGLHISLLIGMLTSILLKNSWSKKNVNKIIFFILLGYLIVTRFSPSILRAGLVYILTQINSKYKFDLPSLDIHSIVFILLMIINPYYLFRIGFVFSFLVSFTIVLTSKLIQNKKTIIQIFYLSIFAQIITFPLVINLNHEINILSPITNVFAILFVSSILLPCSFVVLIVPFLEPFYQGLVLFFSKFSLLFSEHFNISLIFKQIEWYLIVVYYILLYLIIKLFHRPSFKKWLQIVMCLFIFCLFQAKWFINYGTIDFLDLYYGEAILIQEPHGKSTVLIDTGDGTNQVVSSYLLAQGIKKIDLLIITHAHDDHFLEAKTIIKKVNVKQIITSQYNTCMDNYEQTKKVKMNDIIRVGNLVFYVYHPDRFYDDENDNSLVLHVEIGGLKFLLTGDLTTKQEHKIPLLDVDVLKIGHHGSNTSTSVAFLNKIKPEIAIIQTGRIKQFGFPNKELLLRLQSYNIKIYRTDQDYSIRYVYNKNYGYFETLKTS